MTDKMKIEIWSDIACPYCYIGLRKLEAALSQFLHRKHVELVWHSYELNPNLPKKANGTSYYEALAQTLHLTIEEAKNKSASVIQLAEEVGLKYDFENLVFANTSDALRLAKLADKYDLAHAMEEALFRAYFIDAKNVSDRDTLIQLGIEVGIQEADITELLDSNEFADSIVADMQRSEKEFNLQYIPFYLFNNKQIIQGSIGTDEYLMVLTEAYAEWEKNGVATEKGKTISGRSCSIDGVCSL